MTVRMASTPTSASKLVTPISVASVPPAGGLILILTPAPLPLESVREGGGVGFGVGVPLSAPPPLAPSPSPPPGAHKLPINLSVHRNLHLVFGDSVPSPPTSAPVWGPRAVGCLAKGARQQRTSSQ